MSADRARSLLLRPLLDLACECESLPLALAPLLCLPTLPRREEPLVVWGTADPRDRAEAVSRGVRGAIPDLVRCSGAADRDPTLPPTAWAWAWAWA